MNLIKNLTKIIFTVLILIGLPLFSDHIFADGDPLTPIINYKDLKKDEIYDLGQGISISSNVYICLDDAKPEEKTLISAGNYPLMAQPSYDQSTKQFVFSNIFRKSGSETNDASVLVGYNKGLSSKSYVVGIKCIDGTGTESDPYKFEPHVYTLTVILDLGTGHATLAQSVLNEVKTYVDENAVLDESGTKITVNSYGPGYTYDEVITGLYLCVESAIGTSRMDNNALFANLALNPIDHYSSYKDIYDEYSYYYDRPLRDATTYVYTIWATNIINDVEFKIVNPIIGDTVTEQGPKPYVTGFGSDKYHLYIEGNESISYWVKSNSLTQLENFTGEFETNKSYNAYGQIEAALGYYFADNATMKVKVNGNEFKNFNVGGEWFAYNASVESADSVIKEKLAVPTGLYWRIVPFWAHHPGWLRVNDNAVKEYEVYMTWTSFAGGDPISSDIKKTSKDAYNEENKIEEDFSEFVKDHGTGNYSIYVRAIAVEGSDKQDSDWAVYSTPLYEIKTEIKVTSKDPVPEDHDCVARFVIDGASASVKDGETIPLLPRTAIDYSAVPGRGYLFDKFVFVPEKSLTVDNKTVHFEADQNYTIKVFFVRNYDTIPVKVDFCSGHEDLAATINSKINTSGTYESTVSDSIVTITNWPLADTFGSLIEYIDDLLDEAKGTQRDLIDNNEYYYGSLGSKQMTQYKDQDELDKDKTALYNQDIVKDSVTYVHWIKPVNTGNLILNPPICGRKVEIKSVHREYGDTYEQTNRPVYSIDESSPIIADPDRSLWVKEASASVTQNLDKWFSGTIVGGQSYKAFCMLDTKFGYFIDDSQQLAITVNGSSEGVNIIKDQSYYGGIYCFYDIEADHDWEFVDFTWNSTQDVEANYRCKNNGCNGKATLGPSFVTVTSSQKDDYKSEYTARINKDESLDGIEHEESKAFYDVWNLYVGGIHVDGSNYKDILGDGKVNFDPENAKLTINSASIEMSRRNYGDDYNEYGIRSNLPDADQMPGGRSINKKLTVQINGNVSIKDDDSSKEDTKEKYGIVVYGTPGFELTGNGTLDISFDSNGKDGIGIQCNSPSDISISKLNVDVKGDRGKFVQDGPKAVIHLGSAVIGSSAQIKTSAQTGLAFHVTNIDMNPGAILEAVSVEGKAFNSEYTLTNNTELLGAYVNMNASSEGVSVINPIDNSLGNYKYVYIPGRMNYFVASGDNLSWYKGSFDGATFTFKSNVNDSKTFKNCYKIEVDEIDVKETDYKKEEGSAIITLKPSFLETLAIGEHTIKAWFIEGGTLIDATTDPLSADASFIVRLRPSPYIPPRTGIR